MSQSTINKTAFFDVNPETLWAYLTKADKLGEWFHPAESDLKADSEYALIAKGEDGSSNKIIWGKVLIWNPPTTLQYTFEIGPFAGVITTVTWELEAAHGGTKLTLTHEGVGELGEAALGLLMALDDGWDQHIGRLRTKLQPANHKAPDCQKD